MKFNAALFVMAVMSLSLWISLMLYVTGNDFSLVTHLMQNSIEIYEIKGVKEKFEILGTIGDFFNIATSFASVLTVILVSYGVFLQKEEFKKLKHQIDIGGKIDRTLPLIETWNEISKKENDEERVNKFLTNLSLFYNKGYGDKFDFSILGKLIADNDIVKRKVFGIVNLKAEYEACKKSLYDAELDLKHFQERNYRKDKQGKRTVFSDILDSMSTLEGEINRKAEIKKKKCAMDNIDEEINRLATIDRIIKDASLVDLT